MIFILPENDRFLKFLGVDVWHAAGYTGKRGLTVTGENPNIMEEHATKTEAVFHEIAPGRKVVYLGSDSEKYTLGYDFRMAMEKAHALKADTMYMSYTGPNDEYDEWSAKNAPFCSLFSSAGNSDTQEYNRMLDSENIFGVGAYNLMVSTNKPSAAYYSSVTDYVDFSGPAQLWTADGPFPGTSCAAPVLAALAALVNDLFICKTGKPLSSKMMYQFFKDNSTDIYTAGKDTKTGWGVVRLPDPLSVEIEKYREWSIMDFKDSTSISEWAKADVEYIVNLGLMEGDTSKNFNPKGSVTREQMAAVIARLYRKLAE